jgi:hypothetical protein
MFSWYITQMWEVIVSEVIVVMVLNIVLIVGVVQ